MKILIVYYDLQVSKFYLVQQFKFTLVFPFILVTLTIASFADMILPVRLWLFWHIFWSALWCNICMTCIANVGTVIPGMESVSIKLCSFIITIIAAFLVKTCKSVKGF
jgi:hypothetical protein